MCVVECVNEVQPGRRASAEVGIAGRQQAELAEQSESGGLCPKSGHTRPTRYLLDAATDGLAGDGDGGLARSRRAGNFEERVGAREEEGSNFRSRSARGQIRCAVPSCCYCERRTRPPDLRRHQQARKLTCEPAGRSVLACWRTLGLISPRRNYSHDYTSLVDF